MSDKPKLRSKLGQQFVDQVARFRLPPPIYEYRFALDVGRQHRFDAVWLQFKVAVELQGYIAETVRLASGAHRKCVTSGHFSVGQIDDDCDKLNMAQLLGFTVLWFTDSHLKHGDAMKVLQRVLCARGWDGQLVELPKQAELMGEPF